MKYYRHLKDIQYYIAKVIEYFEDNPNCSYNELHNFIYSEMLEQKRDYLEQQVIKIKDKQHSIDVIRILALGLNPYDKLKILQRQVVSRARNYLQKSGHIPRESRGVYKITDPMLAILLMYD